MTGLCTSALSPSSQSWERRASGISPPNPPLIPPLRCSSPFACPCQSVSQGPLVARLSTAHPQWYKRTAWFRMTVFTSGSLANLDAQNCASLLLLRRPRQRRQSITLPPRNSCLAVGLQHGTSFWSKPASADLPCGGLSSSRYSPIGSGHPFAFSLRSGDECHIITLQTRTPKSPLERAKTYG